METQRLEMPARIQLQRQDGLSLGPLQVTPNMRRLRQDQRDRLPKLLTMAESYIFARTPPRQHGN